MKYFPIIWDGLWKKPARLIFTFLSITTAFALFGLLQGVNAAFDRSVEAEGVDRLIVESRLGLTEGLPYADLTQIESVKGVSRVAFASLFFGEFQDPKNLVVAFAIDPTRYFAVYPELKVSKDELSKFVQSRTGALVGKELAAKYGWVIGDQLPLRSRNWINQDGSPNWSFNIVGIYQNEKERSDEQAVLVNHAFLDEARNVGKGTVDWYIARITDPKHSAKIATSIDKLFQNSAEETHTMTEKEFAQAFLKQVGDINSLVKAIVGAVFFTLLFITGNTMMESVNERKKEFAILKAIGFSERKIFFLVLCESLILCVSSALCGLATAALTFPAMKELVGSVVLPGSVFIVGFCISIGLALIVVVLPALRTKGLSVAQALATS